MKFEEALKLMREGKKIRISHMPEDEYYQACYIRLLPIFYPEKKDSLEQMKERGMSIVWMKGDKQYTDMMPTWNPHDPKTDPCKNGMSPMMNLFWIMSDDWQLVGE